MDIEYLLWLQGIREASGPIIQGIFSFLGSDAALVVVIIAPCLAYWCLDKRRAMLALFAYGTSATFNQLLKNTVCCYRPWIRDPRVQPNPKAIPMASGYSFPSGHSQSSASLLGGLGWAWREKRWPLALAVAVSLLIAFSRNFLGVHTPQDVIVGLLEGFAFIWVGSTLLDWAEREEGRDVKLLVASLVALVAYLAFVTLKPYPLDYVKGELLVDPDEMLVDCYKTGGALLGIMTGWVVERRWVRFEVGTPSVLESLARLVLGLVLLILLYAPIGHFLMDVLGDLPGQFLRNALPFFCAIALIPMLFVPLGKLFKK